MCETIFNHYKRTVKVSITVYSRSSVGESQQQLLLVPDKYLEVGTKKNTNKT